MNPLIWIKLLAYEPRRRHVEAMRQQELVAQRARASRGRTMAELRAAVARQVEVHVHTERLRGHERAFELSFTPGDGTLRLANGNGGSAHMSPDALATFLLAPLWAEHTGASV